MYAACTHIRRDSVYSVKAVISKMGKFSCVESPIDVMILDEEEEAEHKVKKRK